MSSSHEPFASPLALTGATLAGEGAGDIVRDRVRPEGPGGEVRLVDADAVVRLRGPLEAARLLFVHVPDVGVGGRGRLREIVEEAIEGALRSAGATPPGITAASDADASLSDQLFRLRQTGRVGLAVSIGALTALCDPCGALEPEDGALVRFLAASTRQRPVVLLLDAANQAVLLYGTPQRLADALEVPAAARAGAGVRSSVPARASGSISNVATREGPAVSETSEVGGVGRTVKPALAPRPRAAASVGGGRSARLSDGGPVTSSVAGACTTPVPDASSSSSSSSALNGSSSSTAPIPSIPSIPSLRDAVAALEDISRAVPLSGLERAFLDGYAPLRSALAAPRSAGDRLAGAAIGRANARALCGAFAAHFARAYTEALPAFAVTRRHPPMTFELFDVAQRCARVHGARATHVVLVDALRWDLGRRVRERLVRSLQGRALCVEEQVLWAVLPTTTAVQLDALARGDDALRAPARHDREAGMERIERVERGRSLGTLRRTRVGHRDLLKVDLLEGRLREPGPPEGERLDALASELTPVLARFLLELPNRALAVVVGDHGFTFGDPSSPREDREEGGATPPAKQGGASPEEVFVSFTAWLVGGVH